MPASRMKQAETAEVRRQVLKARAAGMDWDQIAQNVPGVSSAAAAAQHHRRALESRRELRGEAGEDRAGAIELELTRLDAAVLAVEGVLRASAADPSTHDRVLRAVDRLARLSEVRAGLLGLAGDARSGVPAGPDQLAERRSRVRARRQNLG